MEESEWIWIDVSQNNEIHAFAADYKNKCGVTESAHQGSPPQTTPQVCVSVLFV